MKRLVISLSIASLAVFGTVAAVSAADPTPAPVATTAPVTPAVPPVVRGPATGTLAGILGMSQADIQQLRIDGQTLAQIAESKGIDPQELVDALAAQWSTRIDARVTAGALTAEEAATLKAELAVRAKAMVNQASVGGMRGAAVGAGPAANGGQGGMRGQGMGQGQGGAMRGQGAGGGMRGAGAGTGTCPAASATPSS